MLGVHGLGRRVATLKWWKGYVDVSIDSGDLVITGQDWEIAFSQREVYVEGIRFQLYEYELGGSRRPASKSLIARFSERARGAGSPRGDMLKTSIWRNVASSFELRYTSLDPVDWFVSVIPLYARIWDYAIVSSRLLLFKTLIKRRVFAYRHGGSHTFYFV